MVSTEPAVQPAEAAAQSQPAVHKAKLGPVQTDGLVIMCSDRRYRAATYEFLATTCHITNYDVFAVPGGVYMLSFADALPKQLKVGMRMLKFVMQQHLPPRIVLIAHQDCSRYREGFASWLRRPGFSLSSKQRDDLVSVASELHQAFPGVGVEAYFASPLPDDTVTFQSI
jgi:hypothetical protein